MNVRDLTSNTSRETGNKTILKNTLFELSYELSFPPFRFKLVWCLLCEITPLEFIKPKKKMSLFWKWMMILSFCCSMHTQMTSTVTDIDSHHECAANKSATTVLLYCCYHVNIEQNLWSKISFHLLFESVPWKIKTVLKVKGGPVHYCHLYLMKWLVSAHTY